MGRRALVTSKKTPVIQICKESGILQCNLEFYKSVPTKTVVKLRIINARLIRIRHNIPKKYIV